MAEIKSYVRKALSGDLFGPVCSWNSLITRGMSLTRNRGTANRTFLADGVTGVTETYEVNVGSARVIVASPRRWFSILLFATPTPHPRAHKSEEPHNREHRAIDFSVALRPQRPYGLLGTGSPGRPPRRSHSS